MSLEGVSRLAIDQKLIKAGWIIQDCKQINLTVAKGIAVREFPASTGEVDYALFVDGVPVGVVDVNNWYEFLEYGRTGRLKMNASLLKCGRTSVESKVKYIRQNVPGIYVSREE